MAKSNTPRFDTTKRISWNLAAVPEPRRAVVTDAAHHVHVLDEGAL